MTLAQKDSVIRNKILPAFGSLLINQGFTAVAIAERVGHKSVSTTLDVYAHLFPDQQLLVDRLEELHTEAEDT